MTCRSSARAAPLPLLLALSATCLAAGERTPIGGLQAPEDLDTLGATRLLIVQMKGMTGTGTSGFATLDLASAAVRVLPMTPPDAPSSWGDGSCTAPDPAPGFHGFDRWTATDGGLRLIVVNHGTRSAIERFRLDSGETGEVLVWEGCVTVPADVELNDVAALGESGFAATVMGEARHFGNSGGLDFLLSGKDTGHLATWSPATGWVTLAGSRAPFPNGIAASGDGRMLYFAAWTGRQVLAYDRVAGRISARVTLDFLPDNLSWTPQGTILTAGIPDARSVRDCVQRKAATCDDAWTVSEIDPRTMTARTLATGPAGQLGGASVAVRVGDALYVGAFSGERILRIQD